MSNCCTPEYVSISDVGITGDIIVKRGTGNAPNCGYYEYNSGDAELEYLNYHIVDLKYDTGSGFWTFSGNSTGFNDPTIYRSTKSNNPCDPFGVYTGGIFQITVKEANKWNVYDFDPAFETSAGNNFIGSGIHKNKEVNFKFTFLDPKRKQLASSNQISASPYFGGIVYDVISTGGAIIYENYFSGYKTNIIINEAENIRLFGEYNPNFGIRATLKDPYLGDVSTAELYAYGNLSYIDYVSVQDIQGTTTWEASNKTTQAETTGIVNSGVIPSDEPRLKFNVNLFNSKRKIKTKYLNLYASKESGFEPGVENIIDQISVDERYNFKSFSLSESQEIEANQDYYFALKSYSELGNGNTVKFGPHKIYKPELFEKSVLLQDVVMPYRDSSTLSSFKTGDLIADIESGSGVIDTIYVNIEDFNNTKSIYNREKFLYSTIPTNPSGEWEYTTFDYLLQFKDSQDAYRNTSKKIRLVATGTSVDPINSGQPLFEIIDYDASTSPNVSFIYKQSGILLVGDTGDQYNIFKYHKISI